MKDPINRYGQLICGPCACSTLKPPAVFTIHGVKVVRLQCPACHDIWPNVTIRHDDDGNPFEFGAPPIDPPTPPGPVLLDKHQDFLGCNALAGLEPRILIHRPSLLQALRCRSNCTIDHRGRVVALDRYSKRGFHPDEDTIA